MNSQPANQPAAPGAMQHTPTPWRIEYDNDTGPGDESFSEWWTVTNDAKSYRVTTSEADAKELLDTLTNHAALVAEVDGLKQRLGETTDRLAELIKGEYDDKEVGIVGWNALHELVAANRALLAGKEGA